MSERLTGGVVCATLTPMDDSGGAQVDLLVHHCRWLLDAGCSAIVLLGTTGEANSFTVPERRAVLEGVLARGIPPARLIVGTGCCAAGDTAALTKHALKHGVTRVLMLPPFYYKSIERRGIVDAYARAIDAVGDAGLRVYLYQIPQLTGISLDPPVIEALLEACPGTIAGIKDSSGEWSAIERLCSRFGGVMDVLAGSERYLLAALAAGASGCVTATANADPASICALYDARHSPHAGALQEKVTAARLALEAFPMIPALKELTADRTGDGRWRNLRPPLTALDAAQREALHAQRRTAAAP